MVENRTEWLDASQDRCSTYAFLARMYREELSEELLRQMLTQTLQSDGAAPEADAAGDGQALVEKYIRGLKGADLKDAATQLAVDYASLFLNAGKHPVFPYESVYTSPERLVMQRARDEVVAIYRDEGLARLDSLHEPEDHIAIELEFMAYLCRKSIDALQAGEGAACVAYLQKQRAFLDEHLLVWAPAFAVDVERAAKSDMYRGVAQLTKEYLAQEQETIAELFVGLQKESPGEA